jgi:hypothetical protein
MNGNPFYVAPGNDFSGGLQGLGAIAGQFREEREKKTRADEVKSAVTQAFQSGDPNAMAEVAIQYPEAQQTLQQLYGFKNDQTKLNALDTYKAVLSNKQNPQAALDAINQRIAYVESQGGDPSTVTLQARDNLQRMIQSGQDTTPFFKAAEMEYAGIASPQEWNAYSAISGGAKDVQQAQYVEGLGYVQQLRNGQVTMAELSPDQQAKVRAALEAQAGRQAEAYGLKTRTGLEVKEELEPGLERLKKEATTTGAGNISRTQDYVNRGVVAAEGIPNIKRAITLLDDVQTGGVDKVSIRARQIFGIEGANEGELSYNMGKAVLSQLKDTFGSAFTAAEGERLEKLEAGLGRSPETNKRILKQALQVMESKAKRGAEAARTLDDEFAAQDIENYLSMELFANEQQGGSGTGNMTPTIAPTSQGGWSMKPLGQ